MSVVWVGIWTVFLSFILITQRFQKERFTKLDQKEHPLSFLYSTSFYVYEKLGFSKLAQKEYKARTAWRLLATKGEASSQFELYVIKKLSTSILILFLTITLVLLLEVKSLRNEDSIDAKLVYRPETETESLDLSYRLEEGKQDTLTIQVAPPSNSDKVESQDATSDVYQLVYNYIDEGILNENSGLSYVVSALNLVQDIPEYGVTIQWSCSPKGVVGENGEIYNEDLEQATMVYLTGEISTKLGERIGTYQVAVTVIPLEQHTYDMWRAQLIDSIEEMTMESTDELAVELPKEFMGKKIEWTTKSENKALWLLLLGIIVGVLLYYASNEQLTKEVNKRKKQMILDYPDIVNKLALLIGAGMTVTGAWERIVTDYVSFLDSKKPQVKYAYEEMKVTNYEIRLGVSEAVALEEFGRRLGIVEYMKLSSILIQNMRKGSDGLMQLLSLMSKEAFEQRKQRAKQLGEEAGTKLLLPMMLMLVLVFILILVPAFWSMQI